MGVRGGSCIPRGQRDRDRHSPPIHAESSEPGDGELIEELLVDQLRDILHGEKQI